VIRLGARMSGSDKATASLWEVFSSVPDHRRAQGKRYPLAGLLMIALAAMLAGRTDQLSIIRWGRKLSRAALAELGIMRGRVPAPSVWSELFRALDVVTLEELLGAWVRGGETMGQVAIDGKRLRGSATGAESGVHLIAAFSERLQGVIGQLRVDPDANEITAALKLLKTLPIAGAVVTGDAIFTQTEICRAIIKRGGDYFFIVKSNQPALETDIALAFRPEPPLCGMDARAGPRSGRDDREGARSHRGPAHDVQRKSRRAPEPLAGAAPGLPHRAATDRAGPGQRRDRPRHHQPVPRTRRCGLLARDLTRALGH
jgi:hypothetical protein